MTDNVEGLAYVWHTNQNLVDKLEEQSKKALKENPEYMQAKAVIARIEGILIKFLEDTKQKNAGTKYGTIHTVTRVTAAIQDITAFQGFVIENRAWSAIDWKASSTFAKDFTAEHKELPPGVQLNSHTRLSITAPKEPL